MSWRTRWGWIRSNCGSRTSPRSIPRRACRSASAALVDCMREGARRFGWERRPMRPASLRDGRWLVGYGMAAAIRMHFQGPAKARVRMGTDGIAVVQSDMTDIGGGTYTILTQVAAEGLGLPIDRVRVELGRSDFPVSFGLRRIVGRRQFEHRGATARAGRCARSWRCRRATTRSPRCTGGTPRQRCSRAAG